MASRTFSLEEVVALLGCDEGTEEEQSQEVVDDPDEVLMPGSDEEFDSGVMRSLTRRRRTGMTWTMRIMVLAYVLCSIIIVHIL